MATYFYSEICFNLNFPKYTYGRSRYIVIINVNKKSFRDCVGLVKNNKKFYSHCKCPTLIVIRYPLMKKTFHKHINILYALKVMPKSVNYALPTMWKSTNTIGVTMAEVCHNQASNCQWQCHLVYEMCAHATELSTWGLNHNHKAKGPVTIVNAPVLPTHSVVPDPRYKLPYVE